MMKFFVALPSATWAQATRKQAVYSRLEEPQKFLAAIMAAAPAAANIDLGLRLIQTSTVFGVRRP